MLGTILYAMLDISLNTFIWTTKTITTGIYNSYNYLMDKDDIIENITYKELLDKIDKQNEYIQTLNKDIIELKNLNK